MKRSLLIAAALVLAGCKINDGVAMDVAQDMLAKQLKEPDSAQFQNISLVGMTAAGETHTGWICGEVNARNGFGGYTGFQRFAARIEYTEGGSVSLSGIGFESPTDRELFERVYWPNCQ